MTDCGAEIKIPVVPEKWEQKIYNCNVLTGVQGDK